MLFKNCLYFAKPTSKNNIAIKEIVAHTLAEGLYMELEPDIICLELNEDD
jgi:hypothetical protein